MTMAFKDNATPEEIKQWEKTLDKKPKFTNEKQLREDIYNELFDSGRIAMAMPYDSLDERCYKNTNAIMEHVKGFWTATANDINGELCDKVGELTNQIEKYRAVLEMLSKKPIATWYGGAGVKGGYYASWDDAEYAVKKVLEEDSVNEQRTKG